MRSLPGEQRQQPLGDERAVEHGGAGADERDHDAVVGQEIGQVRSSVGVLSVRSGRGCSGREAAGSCSEAADAASMTVPGGVQSPERPLGLRARSGAGSAPARSARLARPPPCGLARVEHLDLRERLADLLARARARAGRAPRGPRRSRSGACSRSRSSSLAIRRAERLRMLATLSSSRSWTRTLRSCSSSRRCSSSSLGGRLAVGSGLGAAASARAPARVSSRSARSSRDAARGRRCARVSATASR